MVLSEPNAVSSRIPLKSKYPVMRAFLVVQMGKYVAGMHKMCVMFPRFLKKKVAPDSGNRLIAQKTNKDTFSAFPESIT